MASTPKSVAADSINEGSGHASLREAMTLLSATAANAEAGAFVDRCARAVADCVRAGGKVLACGNGGSACDAMHFCEELTGRFRADRPAIPAIACVDPGHITCVANDYGYERVFARWVEALGRPRDVLFVLSTSGNSRNIALAVDEAKKRRLVTVALLGRDGGALAGSCDEQWIVAHDKSDRIQEVHMLMLHAIVEGAERVLNK